MSTQTRTTVVNSVHALRHMAMCKGDESMAEKLSILIERCNEQGYYSVSCPQCGRPLDVDTDSTTDNGHCGRCEQRGQ